MRFELLPSRLLSRLDLRLLEFQESGDVFGSGVTALFSFALSGNGAEAESQKLTVSERKATMRHKNCLRARKLSEIAVRFGGVFASCSKVPAVVRKAGPRPAGHA